MDTARALRAYVRVGFADAMRKVPQPRTMTRAELRESDASETGEEAFVGYHERRDVI